MKGLSEARLPAECGQSFLLPGWRKQRNPLVKFHNKLGCFCYECQNYIIQKENA